MLSLETLSTLSQTNKHAEFHSDFAAVKPPEAKFGKHPPADEENLRPQTQAIRGNRQTRKAPNILTL